MTVDKDYYTSVYGGTEYEDIDRLLIRAGHIIGNVMLISPTGEEQETAYKNAVCAEAEYIGSVGGVEAWQGNFSGNASGFSIGSFSMSGGGSSGNGSGAAGMGICSEAMAYLDRAGLLYRGCGVR